MIKTGRLLIAEFHGEPKTVGGIMRTALSRILRKTQAGRRNILFQNPGKKSHAQNHSVLGLAEISGPAVVVDFSRNLCKSW